MVVSPITRLFLFAAVLLVELPAVVVGDEPLSVTDRILTADRVLIVGDSITYGGQYVAYVETSLRLSDRWPNDGGPEIVGVGLPSEGVTGLTEKGHPFPRPNVHSRLNGTLAQYKPDLVFACYGMNDGIYHPFSEDRFAAYRDGTNKLIEAVAASGADLILVTPPPFDSATFRGKLMPADADAHSWEGAYERYDDVLARYSAWLLDQKPRVAEVVDLHTPYNAYLNAERQKDPKFALAGDGIHPNKQGHAVMARDLLSLKQLPSFQGEQAKLFDLVRKRQAIMRDAWLSHVGHERPGMRQGLPLNEAKSKATELDNQIENLSRNLKGS